MNDLETKITNLEQKIDTIHVSVEKTRKYILTSLIITTVTIVLPLLIAAILIPVVLSSLGSVYPI